MAVGIKEVQEANLLESARLRERGPEQGWRVPQALGRTAPRRE